MKGAGLNEEAAHFLDAEIQYPATVVTLAKAAGSSKDLALQVYAAAHLIAASPPEKAFLDNLGKALSLDPVRGTARALTTSRPQWPFYNSGCVFAVRNLS